MHHQIRDQEMEQPAQVIREEQPHPRDRLRMIKIQLLPRVEVTEAGGKDNRQHRHHKQHHIRARQERTVNAELQIHKISPCRNTGILHHPRERIEKEQEHAPKRKQPELLGRELPEKAGSVRKAGF